MRKRTKHINHLRLNENTLWYISRIAQINQLNIFTFSNNEIGGTYSYIFISHLILHFSLFTTSVHLS